MLAVCSHWSKKAVNCTFDTNQSNGEYVVCGNGNFDCKPRPAYNLQQRANVKNNTFLPT